MTEYLVLPGPDHIHPFANAVASAQLIFVSGLAAPGETAAEQTRNVFAALAETLTKCGSSLSEIVYMRHVVTDRAHVQEVNDAIRESLPAPRPAAGALIIAGLPEASLMVEFEVIAHRGARLVSGD